jgi:glycosyltransferase involved in cell wall biosynthesis
VLYSVVVPAHNEAENLPQVIHDVVDVMNSLRGAWEIVVVDDGSCDDTWKILQKLHENIPQLRALRFRSQSGQTAAFSAGFVRAKGDIIITLDGDGQNDPKDIPRLLEALAGSDCVCGYRTFRRDSWIKRITSRCANAVRKFLLNDSVRDSGCSLKVFRAECVANIKLFRGMHRFLPALISMEGFHVIEMSVRHHPRKKGRSHYSFLNRGISTVSDLLAVWWMKRRTCRIDIEKTLP